MQPELAGRPPPPERPPGSSDLIAEVGLRLVQATEAVALACGRLVGRGDQDRAKEQAAAAMLPALEEAGIAARVVLSPHGEGVLSVGSSVGAPGGHDYDLAVHPVEGAGLVARGLPGAISVAVASEPGAFQFLPAVAYVEKVVVGPAARGAVDLDDSVADNLRRVAFSRDARVADLTVAILDRPRHQDLIEEVRATGARILSLEEGDIAGALLACVEGGGVDVMLGIGGMQEAAMAAAAVRCLGGDLLCRLWLRNDEERILAGQEAERRYTAADLVSGEVTVAVTAVTGGPLLPGVWFGSSWADSSSLLMSTRSSTVRRIQTRHHRLVATE
jgi:fructose-1,6-bisphosphatase II